MEITLEFERHRTAVINLIQNSHYQQAITCCTRLLSVWKLSENSNLAYQYLYWGHCCCRQGKYHRAIYKYKRVLALAPNLYEAYIGWGTCLSNMGRHNEAIEIYKEATELHPSSPLAYLNWILALLLQNKEEEATALAKEQFEKTKYRTLDVCKIRYRNEISRIEDQVPNVTDRDEMKRLVERVERLRLLLQFINKLEHGDEKGSNDHKEAGESIGKRDRICHFILKMFFVSIASGILFWCYLDRSFFR